MRFKGSYDVFELRSADPSRILKAAKDLHIWDIKRSGTLLTLKVSRAESEKFIKLVQNCGIYTQSVAQKGVGKAGGFFLARPMLPAGIILAVILYFLLGSYCYSVAYIGLDEVSGAQVSQYLEEVGFELPIKKSEIDKAGIEAGLFMYFEEFIYVQAEFNGTALELTFQEGAKVPELYETQPCELVATRAGVVVDMNVLRGQSLVSVGQWVEQGQVLVAGEYMVAENPIAMSANGSVTAQVIYEGVSEKPIIKKENVMTGNYATAREIKWGGIEFSAAESPFENYEEEVTDEILLGENSPVCVLIKDVVYYEVVEYITDRSAFAAQLQAREEAYYNALENIGQGAQIIDVSFDVTQSETGVAATAYIITEEEIARRRLIGEQTDSE